MEFIGRRTTDHTEYFAARHEQQAFSGHMACSFIIRAIARAAVWPELRMTPPRSESAPMVITSADNSNSAVPGGPETRSHNRALLALGRLLVICERRGDIAVPFPASDRAHVLRTHPPCPPFRCAQKLATGNHAALAPRAAAADIRTPHAAPRHC